ncbi:MAG: TMEM14 family protein [Cyanobacteria bacterium P01_D01_bin.123]
MAAIAIWAILLFALAIGAGGLAGYLKGKSKVSLISGSISAVLLAVAWLLARQTPGTGLMMAAAIAVALSVVFGMRLMKTRKFMPAGTMAIASAVATVVFISGWMSVSS